MPENLPEALPRPDRWTLIRDIVVLQFKLVVDGFRDFLLVPASLIAGIISLFSGRDGKPGPQFYRLLGTGKQSEKWINLFGAIEHSPESLRGAESLRDSNFDDFVGRMQSFVVREYQRGGLTAQAKKRVDEALDALYRSRRSDNDTR